MVQAYLPKVRDTPSVKGAGIVEPILIVSLLSTKISTDRINGMVSAIVAEFEDQNGVGIKKVNTFLAKVKGSCC